eukprot:CAMPEP_0182912996 /NCGR_PEP_ID=MMETSP0034_2-20130328/37807_1 /TAXON_ID=156128 /ORGANISM="Nephroselmis pyriformis, Strain CCMP717" /LENGTH=131 /DNA_ID=CAMNT_0025049695 /DNA_START=26 /DNA_END=421 /DNA_ORIENTATION=-
MYKPRRQRPPNPRLCPGVPLVDAKEADLVQHGELGHHDQDDGDQVEQGGGLLVLRRVRRYEEQEDRDDGEELLVPRELHPPIHLLPEGHVVVSPLVLSDRGALDPVEHVERDRAVYQVRVRPCLPDLHERS